MLSFGGCCGDTELLDGVFNPLFEPCSCFMSLMVLPSASITTISSLFSFSLDFGSTDWSLSSKMISSFAVLLRTAFPTFDLLSVVDALVPSIALLHSWSSSKYPLVCVSFDQHTE